MTGSEEPRFIPSPEECRKSRERLSDRALFRDPDSLGTDPGTWVHRRNGVCGRTPGEQWGSCL